jgi:hypothetical protein
LGVLRSAWIRRTRMVGRSAAPAAPERRVRCLPQCLPARAADTTTGPTCGQQRKRRTRCEPRRSNECGSETESQGRAHPLPRRSRAWRTPIVGVVPTQIGLEAQRGSGSGGQAMPLMARSRPEILALGVSRLLPGMQGGRLLSVQQGQIQLPRPP